MQTNPKYDSIICCNFYLFIATISQQYQETIKKLIHIMGKKNKIINGLYTKMDPWLKKETKIMRTNIPYITSKN